MGDKNEKIKELQNKQSKLKKEIKKSKKALPYILFYLFIFLATIIFSYNYLVNEFFGDNFTLLVIVLILISSISIYYMKNTYLKIKSLNKQIESINSKLFKLMRLTT